jgi:hypothetical protein
VAGLLTAAIGVANPVAAVPIGSSLRSNEVPPVVVSPGSLPAATGAVPYDEQLSATGGDGGPYTFTLAKTAGHLPPGLNLSASGELTGTPVWVGTFRFTVVASDPESNAGSASFSIHVQPGLAIVVTSSQGGPLYTAYQAAGPLLSGSISVRPFGLAAPSSVHVLGRMTGPDGNPIRVSLSASHLGRGGFVGWLTVTDPLGASPLYNSPIGSPPGSVTGASNFKRVGPAAVIGGGLMHDPIDSPLSDIALVGFLVVANT